MQLNAFFQSLMPSNAPSLQDPFLRPGISRKIPDLPVMHGVSDALVSKCVLQVDTALLVCLFSMTCTAPHVKSYELW